MVLQSQLANRSFTSSISWYAAIIFSEMLAFINVLTYLYGSTKSWFGYYTVVAVGMFQLINSDVKHTAHSVGMRSMGLHEMGDFSGAVQCMIWHTMDVSDMGEQRT